MDSQVIEVNLSGRKLQITVEFVAKDSYEFYCNVITQLFSTKGVPLSRSLCLTLSNDSTILSCPKTRDQLLSHFTSLIKFIGFNPTYVQIRNACRKLQVYAVEIPYKAPMKNMEDYVWMVSASSYENWSSMDLKDEAKIIALLAR